MGNVTAIKSKPLDQGFEFDGRNRLSAVTSSTGSIQYAYDHTGARVWRTGDSGVQYVYFSHEHKLIDDNGEMANEILTAGSMGPNYRQRVGSGGKTSEHYLHVNGRRSTTLVTDETGTAKNWIRYDAYGVQTATSPDLPSRLFLGRQFDSDTDLYYYNARYYQPSLGRFIQADTDYGASVLRHDSANRYAFLLNNPSFGYDPSGHGLPACLIGIGAGLAGTIAGSAQMAGRIQSG